MKRNLILCAVAAVVLSACAKEIVPENSGFQNLKTVTFEAEASSQTRTTLVDGTKVYWCAGDQIYVKGAPEAFTNALEGDETAARAAFAGEVEPADAYYAVYPYVESWEGTSARTKLPVIQQAANGTFGNGYNITAAKTTSQDMTFGFKNVLGYVKFTSNLPEGSIRSVVVSANGGEKISGNIMIDVAADVPVAEALDARSYTAVNFDSELAEGEYYIAMLPGEYAQGLTFDFVASDGYVATVYVDYPLTLKAGHINPIGTIDNLTWYDPSEGSENSIWKGKFVTGDEGEIVFEELSGDNFDWYGVTPGDTLRIYGSTSEYRPQTWSMSLVGIASGEALSVLPEKYEKAETVSVELTEEVLNEICLNEGLGITGVDYCFTNIEIIPAVVEEPEEPVEPEEGVTVIWEGKFDTGAWSGGITDLAYGAYDWSQHKPGDIIKFYGGPTDPAAENWVFSLRLGDDWAAFLTGAPQYIGKVSEYSMTLTQDMIDELVANNGLIIQGDNYTMTRIEAIAGPEDSGDESGEIILWEGENYITWDNDGAVKALAYGGYDWSSVVPGTILKIYLTAEDGASLRIAKGDSWSGIPGFAARPGYNAEWDLVNLNSSTTSFTMTILEEDIDALVNGQGLVVCGDKITVTKIVLLTEVPGESDEVVVWEGEMTSTGYSNCEIGNEMDWVSAGLPAESAVRIYFNVSNPDNWAFQIIEGHWGPKWFATDADGTQAGAYGHNFSVWNTDASLGYIEFDVNEEMYAAMTTQQYWGFAIILQGDNVTFTKITYVRK